MCIRDRLMSVTMKDIAAVANVSIGTVDRALHNRGRIAPEVQERILFIAKQMNYQKNMTASSLSISDKHYKIAVVLHVHQNDFYKDILKGITRAKKEISDFGIKVEIYYCNDFDAEAQLQLIDTAIANGASAMAIVPIDHPRISQKLAQLHEEHFPVLFLSSILRNTPCVSAVRCNYANSGFIAAGLVRILARDITKVLVFTPSLSMLSLIHISSRLLSNFANSLGSLVVCRTSKGETTTSPKSRMTAIMLFPLETSMPTQFMKITPVPKCNRIPSSLIADSIYFCDTSAPK